MSKANKNTHEYNENELYEDKFSSPKYYNNRDLNWLDFNEKILNEGLDKAKPLLEQLKFLAIFHNNLDEFYMVRVANLNLQYVNNIESTGLDKTPLNKQLAEIRKITLNHLQKFYTYWRTYLIPQLKEKNIVFKRYTALTEKQQKYVDVYYKNEVYPVLTPQAIAATHPMPNISSLSLNFLVKLSDEQGQYFYARLKSPTNLPRYIFVPRHKNFEENDFVDFSIHTRDCDIVLLEEIIKSHIQGLFTGYKVEEVGLFRVTRNTDIQIVEDEAHDLLQTVKDMVEQRRFGDVVRLEISNRMSNDLQQFLVDKFAIKSYQVHRIKGILSFSEMISLCSLNFSSLKYPKHTAIVPSEFEENCIENIFESIQKKDILLHLPYNSFFPIQEFIHQASIDPHVIAIKQTLYRTGKNSPIIQSLMEARRRGKQVTAVVELKARFDEEQNITWAEELEKAGVHVVYGMSGMKIHAKLCFVVRKEGNAVHRYVHIGTGNYNPVTAKIYTDLGIFTAEASICDDVSELFNVMTGYSKKINYNKLLVSPVSFRSELFKCIEDEIEIHKKYGNGKIHIKCNQLVDGKVIKKLYKASQAGVKIYLQVRGVCVLRPQIEGISENIVVNSVIGRFLEHSRIFCFNNNNNPKIFFGSADLMTRNLDRRIEVITPIVNDNLREYFYNNIILQYFREDIKAYYLQNNGKYILNFEENNKNKKNKKFVDIQEVFLSEFKFLKKMRKEKI